jgi:hypothetical protein
MRRLSQLLDEYFKIPANTQNYDGHIMVSKDRAQLTLFYEKYRDEIRIMDNVFVMSSKGGTTWSDDAAFGRGILYWLLTEVAPNPLTEKRALEVWNEFVQLGALIHIEEFTQNSLGKVFVDQQTEVLTPGFSYEENVAVLFKAHTVLLLMKMKQYDRAISEIESTIRAHPRSKYAQDVAQEQIRSIRNFKETSLDSPKR